MFWYKEGVFDRRIAVSHHNLISYTLSVAKILLHLLTQYYISVYLVPEHTISPDASASSEGKVSY